MIPFSVVPFDPSLGWRLDLVEIEDEVSRYCHDSEKQLILVVEGELIIVDDEDDEEVLSMGQMAVLEAGVEFSFTANGEVKFLIIDFPEIQAEVFPLGEDQDLGVKIDKGDYAVYEMISGEETDDLWSAALIEIEDSPKHFHKILKTLDAPPYKIPVHLPL